MKKKLYGFLICASSLLYSQSDKKVPFVICNNSVGTTTMFDAYGSKVVNKIFYKKENLPQHLKKFSFLSENGLTEIKLSKDFGTPDILSLQALNKQHDLKLSTPVSIQHYIFNDTETIIYSEIIKKIEVKEDQDRKYLLITISDN